jgi:hypothetical protein
MGYHAALVGLKTSLKMKKRELNKAFDNFWVKGFDVALVEVINPFDKLPDIDGQTIYKDISDHSPIRGVFRFQPEAKSGPAQ